ncbi:copine family C2 domain-containing protein [Nocardia brasiliensis]|uniref:copine family C2 domain-containing protein n=3 Tax=Nocardia brasiliensis TaxID=37326 RepID=UPI002457A2B5|nr:copine family C2 domain-containing protein [Nocardia brasiliensis]
MVEINLVLSAQDLPDTDTLGETDPYLKLYVQRAGGWVLATVTEIRKNDLNPRYAPCVIDVGDSERSAIRIEVWDHDRMGSDELVGKAELSVSEFLRAGGNATLPLPGGGQVNVSRL